MVISGAMATSATTPKASRNTASAPCRLMQAPMAKGRMKPEVMGPLATPPESKAIPVKICGTKKVKYGFTGLYAFAGSQDYYGKKAYIFIALAPVILWGIVLGTINPFVPVQWFWVVYMLQIINLSGAAGDLFVTVRFSRLPKDILVRDYGVGMTVFSQQ